MYLTGRFFSEIRLVDQQPHLDLLQRLAAPIVLRDHWCTPLYCQRCRKYYGPFAICVEPLEERLGLRPPLRDDADVEYDRQAELYEYNLSTEKGIPQGRPLCEGFLAFIEHGMQRGWWTEPASIESAPAQPREENTVHATSEVNSPP